MLREVKKARAAGSWEFPSQASAILAGFCVVPRKAQRMPTQQTPPAHKT
jgi:hypothetical protein